MGHRELRVALNADMCGVVEAMRVLGAESRMLVIAHLGSGPCGFNDLSRRTGLTHKVLSSALRRLISLGFVERTGEGTYALTASGVRLADLLDAWAAALAPAGTDSPPRAGSLKKNNKN